MFLSPEQRADIKAETIKRDRVFRGREPASWASRTSREYTAKANLLRRVVEAAAFEQAVHTDWDSRFYKLEREDGRALYIGARCLNPHLLAWDDIAAAQVAVHGVRSEDARLQRPNDWPLGRYAVTDSVYLNEHGKPFTQRKMSGRSLFGFSQHETVASAPATLDEINLAIEAVVSAMEHTKPDIPVIHRDAVDF